MELHWILTLQWPNNLGYRTGTLAGLTYPRPGETRADVLMRLFDENTAAHSIPASANIMFFDLAPNKLNGE